MARENRAGRLILRGGSSSGLGLAIRFGARFLFLFVAGRLFGATYFGAYSISIAIVESAVIAGGLSTKWMLFKWLNEGRDADRRAPVHIVFDTALLVLAASGAVAALIMGIAAFAPGAWIAANTREAVFALALVIPLQALIELLLAATRWTEVMRYEVVAKSIMQPYASIAVALVAWRASWLQEGLYLSYVAGTLASLGYTIYGLRRCFGAVDLSRYRPDLRRLGAHFRAVIPTAGSELIDALYTRLDIYLVGVLLGEMPAGLYGMARQLSMPIRQVRQAFDGMLIPVVAKTFTQKGATRTGRSIASAARLILLVQLPFVILLVGIGRPLLGAIGQGFPAAFGALLCLAAAEVLQGAFGLSELVLIYSRPRVAVLMTAAFMALGVAGAILLVPLLGLTGVALAVLLSYSARALVRRFLLRRIYSVYVSLAYWAGPVQAGAVGMAAAILLGWRAGPWESLLRATPALVASLAAYAFLLYLWVRRSGMSLTPQGFVAGELAAAQAPGE